jgi:hypothetical protein
VGALLVGLARQADRRERRPPVRASALSRPG